MILGKKDGVGEVGGAFDLLKCRAFLPQGLVIVREYGQCLRDVARCIVEEPFRQVLPLINHQVSSVWLNPSLL